MSKEIKISPRQIAQAIDELLDENDRLNNIIKELEKYLEERGSIDDYNTLKYLKELKENKK